ncbi:MAG: hypothetical protein U0872_09635 [Planctomycetaceae bacterium]
MADYDGSPTSYPPLGLPTGSVRALLTLTCVAVVVVNTARGRVTDLFWVEALLITMAHYFTSRRFVSLPPATIKQLESDGILERESQPLFLPRGSIRALIIMAFVGLGIYLYQNHRERLSDPSVITLLGLVASYFLGSLVRTFAGFLHRVRVQPPSRFWADARALVVLAAVVAVAIPEFVDATGDWNPTVRHVALGLMLFYFGSR